MKIKKTFTGILLIIFITNSYTMGYASHSLPDNLAPSVGKATLPTLRTLVERQAIERERFEAIQPEIDVLEQIYGLPIYEEIIEDYSYLQMTEGNLYYPLLLTEWGASIHSYLYTAITISLFRELEKNFSGLDLAIYYHKLTGPLHFFGVDAAFEDGYFPVIYFDPSIQSMDMMIKFYDLLALWEQYIEQHYPKGKGNQRMFGKDFLRQHFVFGAKPTSYFVAPDYPINADRITKEVAPGFLEQFIELSFYERGMKPIIDQYLLLNQSVFNVSEEKLKGRLQFPEEPKRTDPNDFNPRDFRFIVKSYDPGEKEVASFSYITNEQIITFERKGKYIYDVPDEDILARFSKNGWTTYGKTIKNIAGLLFRVRQAILTNKLGLNQMLADMSSNAYEEEENNEVVAYTSRIKKTGIIYTRGVTAKGEIDKRIVEGKREGLPVIELALNGESKVIYAPPASVIAQQKQPSVYSVLKAS